MGCDIESARLYSALSVFRCIILPNIGHLDTSINDCCTANKTIPFKLRYRGTYAEFHRFFSHIYSFQHEYMLPVGLTTENVICIRQKHSTALTVHIHTRNNQWKVYALGNTTSTTAKHWFITKQSYSGVRIQLISIFITYYHCTHYGYSTLFGYNTIISIENDIKTQRNNSTV